MNDFQRDMIERMTRIEENTKHTPRRLDELEDRTERLERRGFKVAALATAVGIVCGNIANPISTVIASVLWGRG